MWWDRQEQEAVEGDTINAQLLCLDGMQKEEASR